MEKEEESSGFGWVHTLVRDGVGMAFPGYSKAFEG
jgi:hypothetical protein